MLKAGGHLAEAARQAALRSLENPKVPARKGPKHQPQIVYVLLIGLVIAKQHDIPQAELKFGLLGQSGDLQDAMKVISLSVTGLNGSGCCLLHKLAPPRAWSNFTVRTCACIGGAFGS